MTKSIQVISSDILSDRDLETFIFAQSGRSTDDIYFPFRISNGQRYVDIALDPEELEILLAHLKIAHDPDGKSNASKLYSMLGGSPRTLVTLEIGRAEGSDALSVDFVIRFGEQWPVAVYDNIGDLLSLEDMRHRRHAGIAL